VNILIIDDEKVISDFFMKLAQVDGNNQVDTATSSEEALTQVLRKDYNLITLDIQMPGSSGLEVVAMLRNINPRAVIAIITGFLPEEISVEVETCVDVIIPKPVETLLFNQLLKDAGLICQAMDQIRHLGRSPRSYR
jgi:CheY-like chemotaxis protein